MTTSERLHVLTVATTELQAGTIGYLTSPGGHLRVKGTENDGYIFPVPEEHLLPLNYDEPTAYKVTVRMEAAGDVFFTSNLSFPPGRLPGEAEETLAFLRANYPNLDFDLQEVPQ